jgi:hypothetical protein
LLVKKIVVLNGGYLIAEQEAVGYSLRKLAIKVVVSLEVRVSRAEVLFN